MIARFSTLLLGMLLSMQAAASPMKPFIASYEVVKAGDKIAQTTFSLQPGKDGTWRYQSRSIPLGWLATAMGISVTETSTLKWHGNDFIVSEYRYERTGKSKKAHLKFDWDAMKVTNTINGDLWKMDVPRGTVDKLSILLALMTQLKADVKTYRFSVADGGKLKTYEFNILGEDSIDTTLGRLKTIKVSRNKLGHKDGRSTLWLAPELNNFIVRVEKKDKNGELIVLKINTLK